MTDVKETPKSDPKVETKDAPEVKTEDTSKSGLTDLPKGDKGTDSPVVDEADVSEEERQVQKQRDEQAQVVDKELAKRNEANAEGFAKIQQEAEDKASEAHFRTQKQYGHKPTGKSDDALRNTPIIDKDGNKTWR